jgi:hypothetical protein
MARPFPLDVKIGRVGTVHSVHESTEVGIWGFHDKMIVVAHKRKSVQNYTILMDCVGQIAEKLLIISLRKKDLSSFIASRSHMIKGAAISDPKGSCHVCLPRIRMETAYRHSCPMSMADPSFLHGGVFFHI